MQRPNESFVLTLARAARKSLAEGYYGVEETRLPHRSLRAAFSASKRTPIITEIKFRSPAEGSLRSHTSVSDIARAYERGGAAAVSVLTEPNHFEGRIEYLPEVKRSVAIPVLMKDIIVAEAQVEAARKVGADAVLLMATIFDQRLSDTSLERMIRCAHDNHLEVLLEAHTPEEYRASLESEADLVGINNRDLKTLEVSLDTSRDLLKRYPHKVPVICESGITSRTEILELSSLGADGFLVGSALMRAEDVEAAVRTLTGALEC